MVASFLIVLLAFPPAAIAQSRPLDAATVHARLLERGINGWAGATQSNGIELAGRILALNADSFTMQLYSNDPQPVRVPYGDVVD